MGCHFTLVFKIIIIVPLHTRVMEVAKKDLLIVMLSSWLFKQSLFIYCGDSNVCQYYAA